MGRKENEKVGMFNCHGMGGNQVCFIKIGCELNSNKKIIASVLVIILQTLW